VKKIVQLVLGIVAVLLFHSVIVLALGGLAMFVWNLGAVVLLPNAISEIEYQTSIAIMTGIYVVNLFAKHYIKRAIALKELKIAEEILFNRRDKE
jgi:cyanate permease